MNRLKKHSILSIVTYLVIAGCVSGILFGQGTHLHRILVHAGGQLNSGFTIHAHSSHDHPDTSAHHSHPKQEKDNHQHHIAIFDIDGLAISPTKVFTDFKVQPGIISEEHAESQISFVKGKDSVLLLDLPPPLLKISDSYLSSFSFRGPPAA